MTYKVYQIFGNNFCTTDQELTDTYEKVWEITDEQYQMIEAGAELFVENGELLILQYELAPDVTFAELIE